MEVGSYILAQSSAAHCPPSPSSLPPPVLLRYHDCVKRQTKVIGKDVTLIFLSGLLLHSFWLLMANGFHTGFRVLLITCKW